MSHCYRIGCTCSHADYCEFGWVWPTDEAVMPCPVCRADQYAKWRKARDRREMTDLLSGRKQL
jgi:hypothetical protein